MRFNLSSAIIITVSPFLVLGSLLQREDNLITTIQQDGSGTCVDNTHNEEIANSAVTLKRVDCSTRNAAQGWIISRVPTFLVELAPEVLKPIIFAANQSLALEPTQSGSTLQPITKASSWIYAEDVRTICTGVLTNKFFTPGFCLSADLGRNSDALKAEPPNLEDSISQKWILSTD